MKYYSKLLIAALMVLCTLPALAELGQNGYYRIRNAAQATDYISMANDKFNFSTIISAGGGASKVTGAGKPYAFECTGAYLQADIHMVDDPEIIIPGSLIYIQKKTTNNEYNLIGQGTSLLTLTSGTHRAGGIINVVFQNRYITITKLSGSGNDALYSASVELAASMANLGVRYFVDNNGIFAIDETQPTANSSDMKGKWYVEPVNHFNVLPEVELNGKWYTTIKVPFAFTLGGSVEKAYAITANNSGILEYQEITGTIPAGTPVLLQCSSPNATDCQLNLTSEIPTFTPPDTSTQTGAPAADESSSYTGTNLLGGTYFCNTDKIPYHIYNKDTGAISDATLNATHTTAASGKYVIGKDANGKLGFITATGNVEGNVMPANKAWLASGGVFPSVTTPTISHATDTYSSSQSVTITCRDSEATILYSTDGTTWTEYSDAIPVEETTTISAKAIKPGLFNDSEIATSTITIAQPELTVNPTKLTISDAAAGAFTVTGSNFLLPSVV